MYSIVLMMALGQAPAPVVVQDTAYYQEPIQYGQPARRGILRGRLLGRRRTQGTAPASYQGGPAVMQPGMVTGANYQSFYAPPVPQGPAPAEMIVHLPPGAQLTVDGEPTKQMSSTRVFITPNLEPGKQYTYELKAKVQQPSGEVTTVQKVRVTPGQATQVVMNLPGSVNPAGSASPVVDEGVPGPVSPTRRRILRR